jgi:Secreted trypsin-like serine protease
MTAKKWYLLCLLIASQSSSGIFCKQDYEQTRTNQQYKDASFLKEENISSSRKGPIILLRQVAPQEELSLGREIGGKTRNTISSSSTYTVPKIVGGKEVLAGEYPWYSALYRNKNGSETNLDFYCGGMLISSRFVLSGKCVMRCDVLLLVLGRDVTMYESCVFIYFMFCILHVPRTPC